MARYVTIASRACAKTARGIGPRQRRRARFYQRRTDDLTTEGILSSTFSERGVRPSPSISIPGAMLGGSPATSDVHSSISSSLLHLHLIHYEYENRAISISPATSCSQQSWRNREYSRAATHDGTTNGRRRSPQRQHSSLWPPVELVEGGPWTVLPDPCGRAGAIRHLASQPGVHRLPQQLRRQVGLHAPHEPVRRLGKK